MIVWLPIRTTSFAPAGAAWKSPWPMRYVPLPRTDSMGPTYAFGYWSMNLTATV